MPWISVSYRYYHSQTKFFDVFAKLLEYADFKGILSSFFHVYCHHDADCRETLKCQMQINI